MQPLAKYIYDDAALMDSIDLSPLDGKTILITGATGLVGTYFMASLKRAEARGIDVVVAIAAHSEPEGYFKDLLPAKTKIYRGDLADADFLKALPRADYVIHAAGYGQPGKFLDDPAKTLKLNTVATFSLLEKVQANGKFLFVSTSEVYSGSPSTPYKETDIGTTNTSHKRACYIEGKRCGEAIAFAYRAKGIDAKAARLSLAYGPGTKRDDQRVLNSFIAKAIAGEIAMMDDGSAKRTYCYITDAVEMMWDILLSGKDFVYNVGGESKTTIAELGKIIGAHIGVPVKIPPNSASLSGAPEDVWLDLSKVKQEFGKKRFLSLEEGLARTIEWQKILFS